MLMQQASRDRTIDEYISAIETLRGMLPYTDDPAHVKGEIARLHRLMEVSYARPPWNRAQE